MAPTHVLCWASQAADGRAPTPFAEHACPDAHIHARAALPMSRDPVTEFVRLLFVEYDFDGAQAQLALCEEVCRPVGCQSYLPFAL